MSISVFEINNKNNLMIRTFYKNHGEYMFVITSNVILYYFRFWLQQTPGRVDMISDSWNEMEVHTEGLFYLATKQGDLSDENV